MHLQLAKINQNVFNFVALSTALLLAMTTVYATEQNSEDEQFLKAYRAAKLGQVSRLKELKSGLEDHALYSYLEYETLRRTLHKVNAGDIRDFLARHDSSYLASRLRRSWLTHLAKQKRWKEFIGDYRKTNETKLRCHHLTARLRTKQLENLGPDAVELWRVGKSQPSECDPGFSFLIESPLFTDDLVWQRLRLSLKNNQVGLAKYLSKKITDAERRKWAEKWVLAHTEPQRLLNGQFATDNILAREIISHAIYRLSRRNIDRAINAWKEMSSNPGFTDSEISRIQGFIGVAAAKADDPRQIELLEPIENRYADDLVETYRLRSAIADGAWQSLARWTADPPNGTTNKLRWSYWHARALQLLDQDEQAVPIFKTLAEERDYYGYLSADRIDQAYKFNFIPIGPSELEHNTIKSRPGIVRALALYELELMSEARREWAHELLALDKRGREIAAKIAADNNWHERAIATLGMAKSYDDIEVRFPVLHLEVIGKAAEQRMLETSTVYSIIRTESAFLENARSPVGALGLMQLMPATARETAKRHGITLKSTKLLRKPKLNIQIGTAYLASLLRKYDQNFPMAAAAYNAGPHRVYRWRPTEGCTPSDIWIDTIPFKETRRYVRRTLFYKAVYEHRLNQEVTPLRKLMMGIPAGESNLTCVDPLNFVAQLN